MKILLSVICLLLLTSCGPSQEELRQAEMEQERIVEEKRQAEMEQQRLAKEKANRIAAVTCSIMGETKNIDGAVRVREINEAREKIGAEPFLSGDDAIKEAFAFSLCQELVLNDENYDERLQEEVRIAAERRAEEERMAAEEERRLAAEEVRIAAEEVRIAAEEVRIAAEKRAEEERIAATKPSIKEEFFPSGQLKSRTNYEPKNDGGKQHGLSRVWYENGQLIAEDTYENGKQHGLSRTWYENGQLMADITYENGKQHGLSRTWYENGQLMAEETYENGKEEGLRRIWLGDERLMFDACFSNGEEVDISNCQK